MNGLILADNKDEIAVFSLVLQRVGMVVVPTQDLEQALDKSPEQAADIIILARSDIAPQAYVRRVRAETLSPLVIVLNWANEELHYELLESGVDLVVVRPFSARLLIAQIRALLRRSSTSPLFKLSTLRIGDLTLNPATRSVQVNNKPTQRLTHLEFRLLHTLMINRNQILSTETIVEQVWGYDDPGDRKLVRGLISRLRAKIEADPHHPEIILTIPGAGYSFEVEGGV